MKTADETLFQFRVYAGERIFPEGQTNDAYTGSLTFFYQRSMPTPKQMAARKRAVLKATAWNPLPRFSLRARSEVTR